jgi:anthranilate synthase/aminodeoxychorismate synthase-like glutamine amidotransferase
VTRGKGRRAGGAARRVAPGAAAAARTGAAGAGEHRAGAGSAGERGEAVHLVLVDNYDSFTWNLVQYLGELGADVDVFRNDQIDVGGIRALRPDALVLSPGPCTPDEAGITLPAIRELSGALPILGVCLGHQAIGQAFGGKVVRNHRILHGKASPVLHRGDGIYAGLPSPFEAGRYHSLVVERASLPRDLDVTSWTDEGEIMGLRHRALDVEGVQFHPESILTGEGKRLLANWLGHVAREVASP